MSLHLNMELKDTEYNLCDSLCLLCELCVTNNLCVLLTIRMNEKVLNNTLSYYLFLERF